MEHQAIPIVLTGTIVPQAIYTKHRDKAIRRSEYLRAIKYYCKFAPVLFLENSGYDLKTDMDISSIAGCTALNVSIDADFNKGKGYQEFQTLDYAIGNYLHQNDFIKITGRYLYHNFAALHKEIVSRSKDYDFLIDILIRPQSAITGLFYAKKEAYLKLLFNQWLKMDDSTGKWAEKICYLKLINSKNVSFFLQRPLLNAREGSTGFYKNEKLSQPRIAMSFVQRRLFKLLGLKKLYCY